MASKRISISALLSADPSTFTPHSTDNPEPPHKRPRRTPSPQQDLNYSAQPSVPSLSTYGSSWSPHPSLTHLDPVSSRDNVLRYPHPVFDSPKMGDFQSTRVVRDEHNDSHEHERTAQTTAENAGESLVSVLTSQMRTRQLNSPLPAPSQSRRHQHQSYPSPPAGDNTLTRPGDTSPVPVTAMTSPNPSSASTNPPMRSPTVLYPHPQPNPVSRYAAPPPHYYVPYTSQTTYSPSHSSHPPPHPSSPTQYVPISPSPTNLQSVPQFLPSRASPSTSPSTYILSLAPPSSRSNQPTSPSVNIPPPQPPPPIPTVPILQLLPTAKAKRADTDEERLFEDELLSLVDGEDVSPNTPEPSGAASLTSPSKSLPSNRKPSAAKPTAKVTPKAKSSKAKLTGRQPPGPAPLSAMPPPLQAKQQPGVTRAKGKGSSSGSKRKLVPRSRSLSVKPPDLTPAPDLEAAETTQAQDDRLYCLCQKPYDEDKVMIACDRCDEWYHPACVNMPEAEVDLVDQFICASCAVQYPSLRSTYKQRCHRGLNHIASHDPLPPCWKPARGAFSKYCSDECGMAHMRAKIAESGRDPAEIWPAVKNARRREGVTISNANVNVKTEESEVAGVEKSAGKEDVDVAGHVAAAQQVFRDIDEREMAELRRRLDEVMRAREECKLALERVVTRRRLLDLAVERAQARFCGWDARLEMGDAELARWVDTEEGRHVLEGAEGEDQAEWWCQGPEKCPRHAGWQTVRDHDVQLEVDLKNASIKQLTDRERELRRRIEDLDPPSFATPKPYNKKKKQGKKSNTR